MDLNLIKKLVRIVDTSEITDLEVEENGLRIKIARKIRLNHSQLPAVTSVPAIQSQSVPLPAAEVKGDVEVSTNLHEIRSPIVGTFYRAPTPDADPYIQVGDNVSPGSVLCIVEAMKLMNEIESDVGGKVVKILTENGKPVEYNQPLFLIQTG
jgi:acetyl-CoA carboxylase biotin carboxyl carrier protein